MRRLLILWAFGPLAVFAQHSFNGSYEGANLDRVAFPIGGLGSGMFCLEGTGAISHFSIRNTPDLFNEPPFFAAISEVGKPGSARVVEGPVPDWKKFGDPDAARGGEGRTWGLARFRHAICDVRFPFATIHLSDPSLPLEVEILGWSPFIPSDADNSSLPAGALEYRFTNRGNTTRSFVFSYNARLFGGFNEIDSIDRGFVLTQPPGPGKPADEAHFAAAFDAQGTVADYCGFRGGWWDPQTMAWKRIQAATVRAASPAKDATGASLMLPFTLKPGESRTIKVYLSWYCPHTTLRIPDDPPSPYFQPWYSSKFAGVADVMTYWRDHYESLKHNTRLFTEAFYKSTLPPEVLEGIAANLTTLKSTTTLRQYDGRFWAWEGCNDLGGSCHGSCTHVWNYAQALSHLFPAMERTLRETEFGVSQDSTGHQMFRTAIPIRPQAHTFYAASDGQLGGIMKMYRDWRISGDSAWLAKWYPLVRKSMDYCILTWDPRHEGAVEEPHHNTFDIEFWGPEGMCTGFYAGALEAMIKMGTYLHDDVTEYAALGAKARAFLETRLYNGQYFYQQTQWTGLEAKDPTEQAKVNGSEYYTQDALAILKTEGPQYQYGTGCLSDGVLGEWMARVCGLPEPIDTHKVASHLRAVYKYNFTTDLSEHSNPQRPTFALGKEGGLLVCSWPRGGKPSLPFPYSDEVWTGYEYEVASHLIFLGYVREGLRIVRTTRQRYDGRVRNPFDEYECGHWYARAMSSYALLESLTGVRYDAVTKTLYVDSQIGDFTSFLSTDTGFGDVTSKNGHVRLEVAYGTIPVQKIIQQKN